MQGKLLYLLGVLGIMGILFLLSGPVAAFAGQTGGSKVICFDLPGATGLVIDSRGNAYTVCRDTGDIVCITPDGEPRVHARVDGTPTVLAVDRLRTVFVGTESGRIFAAMLDGSVSRVFTCKSRVSGLSIDRDGNLLVATGQGMVIKVARQDFTWDR